MIEHKIKELDELAKVVSDLKEQGKKIVQCHGCFDLVHPGHIEHFISAKKQGDILIVTLTPDSFVQKGPGRPFFNENIRLKQLAAQHVIDYVALNRWPTAVETIKLLRPDVYVKGKEVLDNKEIDEIDTGINRASNLALEEQALNSVGGKLFLTDEITFSSSRIINEIADALPNESKFFLQELKKEYSINNVLSVLESLKNLRVLIIGDSILDEYVYCDPMERSAKEPQISYKFSESKIHLGGVFAVSNHLAGFANNISLITCIGKDTFDLIENSLNKKIERNLFVQNSFNTLIKRRYIDNFKRNKVFQIYNTDELVVSGDNEEKILRFLDNNLQRFDMVVVSDFGHGLISKQLMGYLTNCNKFLAVNCQLNAGNLGYNFITKYNRADFVSLNDRELRLPFQEKTSDLKIPVEKLSETLKVNKINVSLGKKGSLYYRNGNFVYSPSFVKHPIDTIGSGDAMFALTSLLAYKDVEPKIVGFLGNSIGGIATRIIGNERAVDPIELRKFISYILK